jgi:hypothetical protein
VDNATGQAYKNLLPFIPRKRCVIDLLHLLLRCTDRLVHTAVMLCLRAHGANEDDDDKKLLLVNKELAPVMGAAMGKANVSFSKPEGGKTLWSLTRINGSAYRKLLEFFKFKNFLGDKCPNLCKAYQKSWDGFFAIYNVVNGIDALTPRGLWLAKNMIHQWFNTAVNDYLTDLVLEEEESLKGHKNKPLYLASFLLTPYFHMLLVHVPELLENGDLRTFAGQNFEKCNNDHRLYWQVSTRREGEESTQILLQHLRVRLNPVSTSDRTTKRLKCPLCSHAGYRYLGWFQRHMISKHPEHPCNATFLRDRITEQLNAGNVSSASSKEYIHAVVDLAYPALVEEKKESNKSYYSKTKVARKARKALWQAALDLQASEVQAALEL